MPGGDIEYHRQVRGPHVSGVHGAAGITCRWGLRLLLGKHWCKHVGGRTRATDGAQSGTLGSGFSVCLQVSQVLEIMGA